MLASPVVLWGGAPFFARGWASVRNRHLSVVLAQVQDFRSLTGKGVTGREFAVWRRRESKLTQPFS